MLPKNVAALSLYHCHLATCLPLLRRDSAAWLLRNPRQHCFFLFVMLLWRPAPLLALESSTAYRSCRLSESCQFLLKHKRPMFGHIVMGICTLANVKQQQSMVLATSAASYSHLKAAPPHNTLPWCFTPVLAVRTLIFV